jgi:hypothetical protein
VSAGTVPPVRDGFHLLERGLLLPILLPMLLQASFDSSAAAVQYVVRYPHLNSTAELERSLDPHKEERGRYEGGKEDPHRGVASG